MEQYSRISAAGGDPFSVFIDDCRSSPYSPDQTVIAASRLVDINYYLLGGADVHESCLDPVNHFCQFGWREGRKPNMYFDTNWYRLTNNEVDRLEINPVTHYILEGELSGRRPVIYFDPIWYRQTYRLSGRENALAHYLAHRRSQKFSPINAFDVAWYLAQNGPQVGPDRDPFAHYLQAGTLADIDPSANFSATAYRRAHLGRPSRFFPQLMQPDRHNPLVRYLLANYL